MLSWRRPSKHDKPVAKRGTHAARRKDSTITAPGRPAWPSRAPTAGPRERSRLISTQRPKEGSDMETLFVPLALVAGGLLAVQAGANAQLSKAVGSPFAATTLQLSVGTGLLLL